MPKFILIDHSLKGIGGHHFEYSVHVLRAAENAGYEVALATNRKFRSAGQIPDHWPVFPLFPYTTYSDFTAYDSRAHSSTNIRETTTDNDSQKPSLWRRLIDWRQARRFEQGRSRRIDAFSMVCRELFSQLTLTAEDHVFLTTMSELDFAGLADFLAADRHAIKAHWHLQFHYSVFEGREPEYESQQPQLEKMAAAFAPALEKMANYRFHFYNTTAQLSDQYNRMGLARFETLPYPVNPQLSVPNLAREGHPPLRVTCVGAIRAEKGSRELSEIATELWPDCLASGKAQLVVQSNKRRFRLDVPSINKKDFAKTQLTEPPIRYERHPMPMDEYVQLFHRADIGLLIYDSRRYYARCSGVLVEMLAMGIPVVVTAGCWMAEQIAEANFTHLDSITDELEEVGIAKIEWPVSLDRKPQPSSDMVSFGGLSQAAFGEVEVPRVAQEMLVTYRLSSLAAPGVYVRLTSEQFDAEGHLIFRGETVLGQRTGEGQISILVHLRPAATRVTISWSNAYDEHLIEVRDPLLGFFRSSKSGENSFPLGSVGLIAANAMEVPELLRDMIFHWPHYRESALRFARGWSRLYSADQIIRRLTAQDVPAMNQSGEKYLGERQRDPKSDGPPDVRAA